MQTTPPLTQAELNDLPPVVPLRTAALAWGIGYNKAVAMAKNGDFPVPVLTHGIQRKCLKADIFDALRIPLPTAADDQPEAS